VTALETLLELQDHDLALDRLRHRRETLAVREEVAGLEARLGDRRATIAELRAQHGEVAAEEARFETEARTQSDHAAAQEARLYSGEITSPRELQALQADIEQLRRLQRGVEDRQLAAMERREPLETELAVAETELEADTSALVSAQAALAAEEAEIDAEATTQQAQRASIAVTIDAALIADYEDRRAKARGVGAARLVGMTCQGCHLSIPATEVAQIRGAAEGAVSYCDNCGCILVP
jgi:predicted  nucleic acid-binding Zn-ribbon protein